MVYFGKSAKMIKTSGKLNKSNRDLLLIFRSLFPYEKVRLWIKNEILQLNPEEPFDLSTFLLILIHTYIFLIHTYSFWLDIFHPLFFSTVNG